MTFEELWQEVDGLTTTIKIEFPRSLKPITKEALTNLSPRIVKGIVIDVLDEIHNGSIETVDALVRKRLRTGSFKELASKASRY